MKKTVLSALIALALGSTAAFANTNSFKLPEGTLGLYPIQGTLLSVQTPAPRCPAGAMCEPVSVAKLALPMNGCLDPLGPVTVQKTHAADGKLDLYVSALGVESARSQNVRCLVQNVKYAEVVLGMGFYSAEQVRVHFATSLLAPAAAVR